MQDPEKTSLQIRRATIEDVPGIVRLLADDPLGSTRETYQNPLPHSYYQAFHEINSDQTHHLLVAEDSGTVLATLHLTILPYLTYQGGKRAQIEAVRVDSEFRGRRLGAQIIEKAIGHVETAVTWCNSRQIRKGPMLSHSTKDVDSGPHMKV